MTSGRLLSTTALLVLLCGCYTKENLTDDGGGLYPMTLEIATEGPASAQDGNTRTWLEASTGKVYWNQGDEISLFGAGVNCKFTASGSGASTSFNGDAPSADKYYALYPYDSAATIDDDIITTVIPNCQIGVKGGFDPKAALTTGIYSGGAFTMMNVCALVKITLSRPWTSITLISTAGQGIAGTTTLKVSSDGKATASATASSVLLLPEGNTFEAGDYYIAVAPGTVTGGLKIAATYSTNNKLYYMESANAATFTRSKITYMRNVDSSADSKPTPHTEKYLITMDFVDDVANPTKFVSPFITPDGAAASVPTSADETTTGDVYWEGSDKLASNLNQFWQWHFYAKRGVSSNSKQGLRFGRDIGDYLELPAISGARLMAVSYVPGYESFQGCPALCDAAGNIVSGGDAFCNILPVGKTIVWTNLNAADGARYYLKMQKTVNQMCMRRLTLTYLGTPAATPTNARTQAPVVSGNSVTFKGVVNRNRNYSGSLAWGWDNYSAGFQYKAPSAGWDGAANIDLGALTTLKSTPSYVIDLPKGSYDYRMWTKAGGVSVYGNPVSFTIDSEETPGTDQIPDFSRVGYHYGEQEPDISGYTVTTLTANNNPDFDDLPRIQQALDNVPSPGVVYLTAGAYYVSGSIKIKRSGVVLKGDGVNTMLQCMSHVQIDNLIEIGAKTSSGDNTTRELGSYSTITADYVPCGQLWVPVAKPEMFSTGDRVFVYRPATEEWLSDLHMNDIPQNASGSVTQWTTSRYGMYWERVVTKVEGYKVYLDNPIVMGIGPEKYGVGRLYKGSWDRIHESGVQDIYLKSIFRSTDDYGTPLTITYDATGNQIGSGSPDIGYSGDNYTCYTDEGHAWSAVEIYSAEHCWVYHVAAANFAYCCVNLRGGSRHITVAGCSFLDPVSQVTGSRRYAFHFYGSQCCLVRDCYCEHDRHQYVTGPTVSGPNVFLRCSAAYTAVNAPAGPHQRWATGILYDNVTTDARLEIQDRSWSGTGHGWVAVNSVFYNCTAGSSITCQSPWVSGQNWCIGCIGTKKDATWDYWDDLGDRPDGIWQSPGTNVSPQSLYEDQKTKRETLSSLISY